MKKVNQLISLILKHWKPEDLPSDRRRLAQNILAFINAIGISFHELEEILKSESNNGRGTLTRNLSPYLIVVQSVFNICPERIIGYLQDDNSQNKHKILITSEIDIPNLESIVEEKLVRIGASQQS